MRIEHVLRAVAAVALGMGRPDQAKAQFHGAIAIMRARPGGGVTIALSKGESVAPSPRWPECPTGRRQKEDKQP